MQRFVSIGECMIEMSGGENQIYKQGFAGDTLNTAWYARAALPDNWQMDYFTAVGDDIYSDQMLAFLSQNNIGTQSIRRIKNKRPGLYMIHQAEGDRHFTYWRDRAAAKQLADDAPALRGAIKGADLIYFSGITLAILSADARTRLLSIIGEARSAGAKTAFDPNIRPILWPEVGELKSSFEAAAKVSTFVLPTHDDEKPIFGDRSPRETAERYLNYGAEEVVVKNGGEDALIVSSAREDIVPAKKDAAVIDTTGAGDSFNGAYLSARLLGHSTIEAAEVAHRTASIVIGHKGALVDPDLLD